MTLGSHEDQLSRASELDFAPSCLYRHAEAIRPVWPPLAQMGGVMHTICPQGNRYMVNGHSTVLRTSLVSYRETNRNLDTKEAWET